MPHIAVSCFRNGNAIPQCAEPDFRNGNTVLQSTVSFNFYNKNKKAMRNLGYYFENPFPDPKISRTRKQAFGEDSLARIAVQNTNNQFDELLNKTETVQTALFGGITSQDTLKAMREARTRSADTLLKAFTSRNSRLNSYLVSTGTDQEDVYLEIFPGGVQAFTRDVKKENAELKMQTMLDAVTANADVVGGANVVTEYKNFITNYNKVRGDQQTKKGEISGGIVALNDAEAAWDDQMFSNLLTFAQLNRNQPDNVKLYMDPSLLEADERHTTTETGKVKGTLTDAEGHPLANVLVHVVDGKVDNAHTDENGDYETHPLPKGKWVIEYTKGDKKEVKDVLIEEGSVLVVDVVI